MAYPSDIEGELVSAAELPLVGVLIPQNPKECPQNPCAEPPDPKDNAVTRRRQRQTRSRYALLDVHRSPRSRAPGQRERLSKEVSKEVRN